MFALFFRSDYHDITVCSFSFGLICWHCNKQCPLLLYYQIRDSSTISSALILNPRDNIKLYTKLYLV